MTKLYELTEAYVDLLAQLEDCTTPDEEAAIASMIDSISDDIARKGEAFARLIRNLQSDADGYAAEIKRLTRRKQIAENAIERLKGNILFSMGLAGATELHTTIGKWRIQKNPPSVVISDESKVPEEFTLPQPPKVVKSMIMAYWKDTGEIPEGCDIVQSEGVRFR